jgi:hypothetical protein
MAAYLQRPLTPFTQSTPVAMAARSEHAATRPPLDTFWIVIALSLAAVVVTAAFRIQSNVASTTTTLNATEQLPEEWPAPARTAPSTLLPIASAIVIAPPTLATASAPVRAPRWSAPRPASKAKTRPAASAKSEAKSETTKAEDARALETLRQAQLERPF